MEQVVVWDEFVVGYRVQREWRWLILAAFFLGGMGAGLFLVSMFQSFVPGMVAGLIVVVFGKGTAHLMFLGRPDRFWRAFLRPFSSWISRGIWVVVLFSLFAALYTAPSLISGLPWSAGSTVGQLLLVLSVVFGFLLMIYTGFVMSYSPSIPFWNTTLLPVLFVLYSAMAGTASVFALLPFTAHEGVDLRALETVEIGAILAALLLQFVYLGTMSYSTLAAKESVRSLVRGELAPVFLLGVIVVGLVIPLIGAVAAYYLELGAAGTAAILASMGILELAGGFLFRYCLLKVGYYNPVI